GNSVFSAALTLQAGSTVTVTGAGATLSATGTTLIDGANIYVTAGAHVSLPNAASYSHAASGNDVDRHLQATGAGSLLDLGGLTSIKNSAFYDSHLYIDALVGGQINLAGVAQISDG